MDNQFQVQGRYKLQHFLEFCFSQEFQFHILNRSEKVVTVTFHKGTWSLYFHRIRKQKTWIDFNDSLEVEHSTDHFYKGTIEGIVAGSDGTNEDGRRLPAAILAKFLCHFYLPMLISPFFIVEILQEGRNGVIEKETGEVILSPRQKEFRFNY